MDEIIISIIKFRVKISAFLTKIKPINSENCYALLQHTCLNTKSELNY